MAEHDHGTMDIEEHEKTFRGFLRVVTWIIGISLAILIFLAIFNS